MTRMLLTTDSITSKGEGISENTWDTIVIGGGQAGLVTGYYLRLADGLYFVGSMFQYGLTSTWLGGVSRDAEFVCRKLASRRQTV
jgi:hypothetical protein